MQFKDSILQLPVYKPSNLTATQPGSMVKLSSNENALGPSPRALAAMQAAIGLCHSYPDSSALALRVALANRVGLSPNRVICGNGSDELIMLLSLGFLSEGDEAVMAAGTFISYLLRTREMGGTAVQVPLRPDYTHNLPAMLAAITSRTRLLYVCNPNNPTGTSVGADEISAFLAAVPDHVLVVMDEAYVEYAIRPDFPDTVAALRAGRKNLIILRTFAKIHGLAGLRLGYGLAHPEVIEYLHRARPVFNVNTLAQVGGLAALDDEEHIARTRAHAQRSRAFFEHELGMLGLQPIASETNFIAVYVGDDGAIAEELRQQGYAVMPISGWGVSGCIRISFGTMEQNAGFMAALRYVLEQRSVLTSI
ncbi:MAG: histidinol-phosphate transaminase [Chloroflexaceae bacterium]|nr:histidinol-phosphate transaminase [Chloroflexaceae bacterium]NJO04475.1 histidinol-phosphate transaminase [Chloroflexaceae bacterium]